MNLKMAHVVIAGISGNDEIENFNWRQAPTAFQFRQCGLVSVKSHLKTRMLNHGFIKPYPFWLIQYESMVNALRLIPAAAQQQKTPAEQPPA